MGKYTDGHSPLTHFAHVLSGAPQSILKHLQRLERRMTIMLKCFQGHGSEGREERRN